MTTCTYTQGEDLRVPAAELDSLGLPSGSELMILKRNGRIEIAPVPDISDLMGSCPGLDSDFTEEREREWRN